MGIFYNHDQKWTMGHPCHSQFLLLLDTTHDEPEEPPDNEQFMTTELEVVTRDISSLNTLDGKGNPCSLRLTRDHWSSCSSVNR